MNTKISKCKNKIPVVSDLVKKTDNDDKIRKYISTALVFQKAVCYKFSFLKK